MPNPADKIENALNELRESYTRQLPLKVGEIEKLWLEITQLEWDNHKLEELHRNSHSLAGSGSTFGLTQVSKSAKALENSLTPLLKLQLAPQKDAIKNVQGKLVELKTAACSLDKDNNENFVTNLINKQIQSQAKSTNINFIWYLTKNLENEPLIFNLLNDFGFETKSIDVENFSLDSQNSQLSNFQQPDLVIVDYGDNEVNTDAKIDKFLATINKETPSVILSTHGDINSRLYAVRNNCKAFITYPIDTSSLIDIIDKLSNTAKKDPYRVLIVDDSTSLASTYSAYLQLVGMETRIVTEPYEVLDHLHQFNPELILLDMYMPGCSGQEIASVIRQKVSFASVPIVFLSAEADRNIQLDAMSLGGDDFLTKPIQAEHLISAVTIRADRYRGLRTHMIRDSLTGLLNHTKTEEQLEIEISRASRSNTPLAYGMLDIDKFKSINDTYGHAMGDRIIKSLSRLLQQSLRKTDIVGRYGGEEFAVVLTSTDAQTAHTVLEKIRVKFENIVHNVNGIDFRVTFSCGIASFPQYETANQLNDAADKALYSAKSKGRNQIIVANKQGHNN